jgi:SAM-dependent methyltransferase
MGKTAFMKPSTSKIEGLQQDFLKEYSTEANIRRYMRRTAGHGISYLLEHDYTDIYLEAVSNYILMSRISKGLRILEFGCGAGMNLVHLISVLKRRGIVVEFGCGTDFSQALIETAKVEARESLEPQLLKKVQFCVARNENLVADMTRELESRTESITGSFDLILGVNTFRYGYRLENENDCAKEIYKLLANGGLCIIIDMNDKFPAFRSSLRDRMRKEKREKEATFLPSLDEYARPFVSAGFEILRKDNFCWIPHSGGRSLTATMRFLTPFLNLVGRQHAMRSLVICRKANHRNGQFEN